MSDSAEGIIYNTELLATSKKLALSAILDRAILNLKCKI